MKESKSSKKSVWRPKPSFAPHLCHTEKRRIFLATEFISVLLTAQTYISFAKLRSLKVYLEQNDLVSYLELSHNKNDSLSTTAFYLQKSPERLIEKKSEKLNLTHPNVKFYFCACKNRAI